jgi:glutathione reductase (NADPH)
MTHYDTIVIGAGPGAMSVGPVLAAKQKVLMVERDKWGGTCPNRGCDPKKVLYNVTATYLQAQRFAGVGMPAVGPLDWAALRQFESEYTQNVSANMRAGMASSMDVVDGSASFKDAHTLDVDGTEYSADNIVIATGAAPTPLPVVGGNLLLSSDDFLSLEEMPSSLAFIGAGYITAELASIASAAGAKVHVIQVNDRFLAGMPKADSQALEAALTARGVQFHWNTSVDAVEEEDGRLRLHTSNGELLVGSAIAAIGRTPAIADLNLARAGVQADKHGVIVDAHMQTSVPNIFALGDVVSSRRPKLTPVASFEGSYVAKFILGETAPIEYPVIPTVAYSFPQLAQVGINADDADPEKYTVKRQQVGNWFNYWHMKDPDAMVTTVLDKQTGELCGASIFAAETEELINAFTQLINQKATLAQVNGMISAYPTYSSDLPYYL